jgi:Lon protease-like protein
MDHLPLMPLNGVLFPGMVLPLHIVEDRFRSMITWCEAEREPFGVSLIRASGADESAVAPLRVGTMAMVARVDRLDDGCLNVLAIGRERFRVRALVHDEPYLVCEADAFPFQGSLNQESEPVSARLHDLLRSYLLLLPKVLGVNIHMDQMPTSGEALAWVAGAAMQVDDAVRQRFLEHESLEMLLRDELALLRIEHRLLRFMVDTQEAKDATDLTPFWHWSPN